MSDKKPQEEKTYDWEQISNLKNLQNLHRFVLQKDFSDEILTEKEWNKVLKDNKII